MKKQPHKVWQVRVGSLDDETRDRRYVGGKYWVRVIFGKLPERAVYYVEAKGQGAGVAKKALRLAAEEGIPRPVVLSLEWVNCPAVHQPGLPGSVGD